VVVAAAGIVVWLRIVLGADTVSSWRFYPLLVGVCASWVASVTALLVLVAGAVEHRRRGHTAVMGPTPARLWMLVGVGLVIAMAGLLASGTWSEDALLLALLGAAIAGIGWWRRARPPTRFLHVAVQLGVVVLAFQVPREQGRLSLRWANSQTNAQWSWNGGSNCNGTDLGGRPAALNADRPAWVIRASGTTGDLGEAVARRLGRNLVDPPGTAVFNAMGQLNFAGFGCDVPGYRSGSARGSVTLSVSYNRNDGQGTLSCGGSYLLSYTVEAQLAGIGSCRQLTDEVAAQIVAQFEAQARAVTGRQ
jgi:hypothetical protein